MGIPIKYQLLLKTLSTANVSIAFLVPTNYHFLQWRMAFVDKSFLPEKLTNSFFNDKTDVNLTQHRVPWLLRFTQTAIVSLNIFHYCYFFVEYMFSKQIIISLNKFIRSFGK
jgi:hypothetical protein